MKNNSFLKYLKLLLKRSLKPFVIIFAIQIIFYIGPLLLMREPTTTEVGLIITILVLLCYIVPISQNAYLMNKKSIDTYYAMPISRRAIMNAKLLAGLIEIIVSYTIVYYFGIMIMAIRFPELALINYIPLYFITILLGTCLYVFNFFIASRANTIVDAVIFIVLYTFGLGLVVSTIMMPFEKLQLKGLENFDAMAYILFVPFVEYGNYFNDLILMPMSSMNRIVSAPSLAGGIVTVVLGSLGLVGLEILTPKDHAERAEEISNSIFGYKILTPIYFLCMIIIFLNPKFYFVSVLYLGISVITYLVLSIIRYRKFKLPLKSFIVLGGTLVSGIVISIILNAIIQYV